MSNSLIRVIEEQCVVCQVEEHGAEAEGRAHKDQRDTFPLAGVRSPL